VEDLLQRTRAALPAGGALLIAEPLAETKGARAMGDAYFGMYLWAMGSGKPRSYPELGGMLRRAGFHRVKRISTRRPILTGLILAQNK
jgi:demethylspheroidene O-methyltransferase